MARDHDPRWHVPDPCAGPRVARSPALALALTVALAMPGGCQRGDTQGGAAGEVRIAAASNLSVAFRELESAFERAHGSAVSVEYGSSGLLAAQIGQGAPFDAFYSADEAFAIQAIEAGACDGATRRIYARGQLVVWSLQPASTVPLVDLSSLLEPAFQRIAIANPDQAPYGRAARDILQRAGLWDALASRMVLGEDVKNTFQLVQTGLAEAGFVPRSLVQSQGGRFLSVDDALHGPLSQMTVQCKHGKNPAGARAFDRFVASEAGAAILRRHGYEIPAS